jgi:hypothetical protein
VECIFDSDGAVVPFDIAVSTIGKKEELSFAGFNHGTIELDAQLCLLIEVDNDAPGLRSDLLTTVSTCVYAIKHLWPIQHPCSSCHPNPSDLIVE